VVVEAPRGPLHRVGARDVAAALSEERVTGFVFDGVVDAQLWRWDCRQHKV
jgi:hypothetical protein